VDTDSSRWRHRCEDRGCYLASRWSLTELDGTLPRGIGFGDIDGMVEIGGRFLFIEHKPEGYGYEIAVPGGRLVKVSKAELRDMVSNWAGIATGPARAVSHHGDLG
jgi:hypothetical protein